jgi:hypothetical protein
MIAAEGLANRTGWARAISLIDPQPEQLLRPRVDRRARRLAGVPGL